MVGGSQIQVASRQYLFALFSFFHSISLYQRSQVHDACRSSQMFLTSSLHAVGSQSGEDALSLEMPYLPSILSQRP